MFGDSTVTEEETEAAQVIWDYMTLNHHVTKVTLYVLVIHDVIKVTISQLRHYRYWAVRDI